MCRSQSKRRNVWQNQIGEHLEVNLSAKNLLNPTVSLVRENTGIGDVTIREYTLGVNLGLTLAYKF